MSISLLRRPVIQVHSDGELVWCDEFGELHGYEPSKHACHTVMGNGRMCTHRTEPMPQTQLFDYYWLSQLHWQAILLPNAGIVAGREGDVVSLAVDEIGPVKGCTNHPNGEPPQYHWRYQLYRLQWWDAKLPSTRTLLGVWPDYAS